MGFSELKRSLAEEVRQQEVSSKRREISFFFLPPTRTHSDVVNSHPHGPVVIDLLCGDRFSLVGQKYAQQQQQTLVAVNHAYRKWTKKQEIKKSNQMTGGMSERAALPFTYREQYTTVCV